MQDVKIVQSSEDSMQIQFTQQINEEVNTLIGSFVKRLKKYIGDAEGIEEILPTYCSVTVYFDPARCKTTFIEDSAKAILEEILFVSEKPEFSGKIVEIPVCYDDDFAPDLKDVAEYTGLTEEEVIKLHCSKDYLIYMLGFLPGFPYLGGMDEVLETPRLETPRTKIAAGSVAIGGKQAGLYPSESPGGWRIIGRTPVKVFDQNRNPACLYEAGDKIRFVRISKEEYYRIESEYSEPQKQSSENKPEREKNRYVCTSGIKILEAGMLTTIQDKGRKGYQSSGIGQSGVMDSESYDYANYLLENDDNAACLEATVLGPAIEFVLPCDFVLTGGQCSPTLNDQPVPMNKVIHAESGSVLRCGFITRGLRTYIAFAGGLLVPEVLGSRSTNTKSKMGGYWGRKLEAGDQLAIGDFWGSYNHASSTKTPLKLPEQGKELVLKCTKGSQFDLFSDDKVRSFQANVYTVLPESDRMGIRFGGESLKFDKTDIISDAIPFGSIQITSAGLPVVMAADRQTTGGYAKIAAVTRYSMCQLAQAVPGTKVKFMII